MSEMVSTSLGRFRRVTDGKSKWFLWECPCGTWASLSEQQMDGKVSVDHASMGCKVGYHETHEYGKALATAIIASRLTECDSVQED